MSLKVFISATKEDLDKDCRPKAKEAIEYWGATAITMETWDTDFENSVQVCKSKLEESDHYLGIFAYRYGWRPPGQKKSITELEFEWANEKSLPKVVFIPDHTSDYAKELKKRGKNQTKKEKKAQKKFKDYVFNLGVCQQFSDLANLSIRIARKVAIWLKGGSLLEIAKKANTEKQTTTYICKDDIIFLGRKEQVRQFEDSLDTYLENNLPVKACFLIHGNTGFGHEEIVQRLCIEFEEKTSSDTKIVHVNVDAVWRQRTWEGIINAISSEIGEENDTSITSLILKLKDFLDDVNVVVKIGNIQRIENTIENFYKKFWEPIVSRLSNDIKNKLIVFLQYEGQVQSANDSYFVDATNTNWQKNDLWFKSIIKLSPLQHISQKELSTWLSKWIPQDKLATIAETLYEECKLGFPQLLFYKLLELDISGD